MDKVSVIIPVHNVEDYISDCIKSVCDQTYKDLQIIIIDDGSTDNSALICERYYNEDDRIIFVSQENMGVCVARNKGLKLAKGKFICFVDADDVLEINAIDKMINELQNEELLISRYSQINEKGHVIGESNFYNDFTIDNLTMIDYLLFPNSRIGYQGYLWNKLFYNDIIKQHSIQFTEGIIYNEDRLFILQYLIFIKSIRLTITKTYRYRIRLGSAMDCVNKSFSRKQLTELKAFEIIENKLKQVHNPLYRKSQMATFYCACGLYYKLPHEYIKERKYLKKVIKRRIVPSVLNLSKFISIKERCRCLLYFFRLFLCIK